MNGEQASPIHEWAFAYPSFQLPVAFGIEKRSGTTHKLILTRKANFVSPLRVLNLRSLITQTFDGTLDYSVILRANKTQCESINEQYGW